MTVSCKGNANKEYRNRSNKMIKLGEMQKLTAVRKTDNGFYLKDESDDIYIKIYCSANDYVHNIIWNGK